MDTGNAKRRALEAIERLPEDATIEDAIERLYFLSKVQKGLEQSDRGETVAHEAARKRLLHG